MSDYEIETDPEFQSLVYKLESEIESLREQVFQLQIKKIAVCALIAWGAALLFLNAGVAAYLVINDKPKEAHTWNKSTLPLSY